MSTTSTQSQSYSSQKSGGARERLLQKRDDDVVIVASLRSAITKGRKGGFKDTNPEEILSKVMSATYKSINLDPSLIQDVCVGNVLPPSGGASAARMAALHAGIPHTSSLSTVNRQCSSGLTAITQIANAIKVGQIEMGMACGVESMTKGYGPKAAASEWSQEVLSTQEAEDCLIPMGITSENVAEDYKISRQAQDEFAARSFQKAAKAQERGYFRDEIIPLTVSWVDPSNEEEKRIVVDADDGIRSGVTAASLARLKPAFKDNGSTHAGNASQVSDGAACAILTRRDVARKRGLKVLGKFVQSSVAGVPPRIMGVGPAYAIPAVLSLTQLPIDQVDFFEINEAFASQALMSIQTLQIPEEKVNPNGGAIALGHPLGCTGARQVATAFAHAKRTGEKVFVTSMCIGSGMGMAAVFVNEQ